MGLSGTDNPNPNMLITQINILCLINYLSAKLCGKCMGVHNPLHLVQIFSKTFQSRDVALFF